MSLSEVRMATEPPTQSHDTGSALPPRVESRETTLRSVEYSRYPRVCADARTTPGFTRDLSESGLCIGVDRAEKEGSLLRVVVRDAAGYPARDSIARVVWCGPRDSRSFWLGLAVVAESQRQMRVVRVETAGRRQQVPVNG